MIPTGLMNDYLPHPSEPVFNVVKIKAPIRFTFFLRLRRTKRLRLPTWAKNHLLAVEGKT